jgi:hypothetical protein
MAAILAQNQMLQERSASQGSKHILSFLDGSRATILGHREALAWAGQGRDLRALPAVEGSAEGEVMEVDDRPAVLRGGGMRNTSKVDWWRAAAMSGTLGISSCRMAMAMS